MAHDKDTREIFAFMEPLLKGASPMQNVLLGQVFTKLVLYVKQERVEALGWMYGEFCGTLEEGDDPRELDVAALIEQAEKALCPEEVFVDLSQMVHKQAGKDGKIQQAPVVLGLKEVMTIVENLRKTGQI